MAKLPVLSALDVVKALAKLDFNVSRQRGSHIVLVRFEKQGKRIVVVPNHRQIDPGTLLSIISQADTTKEDFLSLIK
ncbi:MAG: type II toxin-antitoxin system HicA family toxin [Candidatus Micrarchaeota archaeon]|nr:type II toxin-antitoxin system HicA family toxin [Candidatus Micrarchaeota archaeon]